MNNSPENSAWLTDRKQRIVRSWDGEKECESWNTHRCSRFYLFSFSFVYLYIFSGTLWCYLKYFVIMPGAESRLESRLEKLKSMMNNPMSELNMATLLVSARDYTPLPRCIHNRYITWSDTWDRSDVNRRGKVRSADDKTSVCCVSFAGSLQERCLMTSFTKLIITNLRWCYRKLSPT